jgi:sugar O-acyltransferase (sialic acid O-acetyltransferase NeuD family)
MNIVGVYGASGFGREVLPVVRQSLRGSPHDDTEVVFIDDNPRTATVNEHRVFSFGQFCAVDAGRKLVALAVADSRVRERLAQRCIEQGVAFLHVQATNVIVLDDVTIGEGAILAPFVTLTSNIRIGRHFHANLYSYVAHDCVIGDFVTFAPAVHCNGNVVVEDHAYVGTGATLRQGTPGQPLVIGRGAVVGMGAVVTKSVPAGVTVVGNPARLLQRD